MQSAIARRRYDSQAGWRVAASTWHLLTAASALIGMIWQLEMTLRGVNILVPAGGRPPGSGTRVVRYLSYFTIESNILVAVTCLVVAWRPDHDGRIWRTLRLAALFGITVTGVVYSTLLRGLVELHGPAAVTNALLHYVAPAMAVLGWFIFGPRPRIDENTLLLSLIWPALYVAYSFGHGAATDWYPYPFIDVTVHGYVTVVRNGVAVVLLMLGIASLFRYFDSRLPSASGRSVMTRARSVELPPGPASVSPRR